MTRRPLARTYRPQRFDEVLGQKAPVAALGRAASTGQLASAYIFSGTRGIGKTTIARLFAKTLNCENGPAADCCSECTPCVEIADGRSLDVLELDAATHTGIDDVRELREAAQYPPGRERYRVFIIDEAHQLSQAAWNGLLKILEEPPDWCVFMLCTTEPHKIPRTIESRSLHFAFRSPSPAEIERHLSTIAEKEKLEVEPEALRLLVKAADGSVRDGLSALDQVRALADGAVTAPIVREALGLVSDEAVERYVTALAEGDAASALSVVADLEEEGQDLRVFVGEVLERIRGVALARATGKGDAGPGGAMALEEAVWIGQILDRTDARLRQGGPARTLVDLATVRMTAMTGLTPLDRLIEKLDAGGGPSPPGPAGRPGAGPARGPKASAAPAVPPRPASRRPEPPSPSTSREAFAPGHAAPEPAPSPAPDPSEPGAAPSGRDAGDLLPALLAAVKEIRPPMAAYLARAERAVLDEDGTLSISLPPGKAFWRRKLIEGVGREALTEAAVRVAGRAPKKIEVQVAGGDRPQAAPEPPRSEVLDEARRDPLVRAIFDRFGAVVVDGSSLAGEKEATGESAAAAPAANEGPGGDETPSARPSAG